MTHPSLSVALPQSVHSTAVKHLLRADGQEDLCFALWHESRGRNRTSALIREILLPLAGERRVHGNASFLPQYFERALAAATKVGAGVALLHSHPGGCGWQGMSSDDVRAEQGHAAAARVVTSLPLLGLTLAGDESWSARQWHRVGPRKYAPAWCTHVRVAGEDFMVTYNDALMPPARFREQLRRTVSAWGAESQADLARLHVGVVGAGSVGSIIAEALARTGLSRITLIDFDAVELVNLDRLLHATQADAVAHAAKVNVLARALRSSATAEDFRVSPIGYSVCEDEGFRAALDCDVIFSCVDRPWGRHVLNFIAYAHLIPVVDGGILVRVKTNGRLRGADWRAHVAAPGRRCLACLNQYDLGLVAAEREGHFDDPTYIQGLPEDHPAKRNENVFAFSLGAASLQVLQALSMVIAPSGVSHPGAQTYHFVTGRLDVSPPDGCDPNCSFPPLLALGDGTGLVVTGQHAKALAARATRDRALEAVDKPKGDSFFNRLPAALSRACRRMFGHQESS